MPAPPMDLTPELVAFCERKIEEPGPDPHWVGDAELKSFAQGLVAQRPQGPFWIFAYGSLIWKPTFAGVRRKRGIARGWHRSFCPELDRWRATPEQRGLMMALAHGGSCAGLLYELPEEGLAEAVYGLVWREISFGQISIRCAGLPSRAMRHRSRRSPSGRAPKANASCADCRSR